MEALTTVVVRKNITSIFRGVFFFNYMILLCIYINMAAVFLLPRDGIQDSLKIYSLKVFQGDVPLKELGIKEFTADFLFNSVNAEIRLILNLF